MIQSISQFILRVIGWQAISTIPPLEKYLLVGAPHTTNWDFPLTLLALSSLGVKFNWVAKHTLFWWPLGLFLRVIGGIPVDRSGGMAFLKQAIELYKERDKLILAIAPEGTRSRTSHWKSGFYVIARKANVPIVLGSIDYPTKQITIGMVLMPSGNIEKDFKRIREFYRGKEGKYPEKQGEVRLKKTSQDNN
ncbi:MAG: lysophospholipid acyltransferase family protein, partial [Deltaproteobacteria bacterium]|nr:lysophospholipid acyltransferase family protein [Deltaproteobacteria bacterium]